MAESNPVVEQGQRVICSPPIVDVSPAQATPSKASGQVTIAFDTWPLKNLFRNTGIYVYARNLLAYFQEHARDHSVEIRPLLSSAVSSEANHFQAGAGFRPYETSLLRIGRVWRYGG